MSRQLARNGAAAADRRAGPSKDSADRCAMEEEASILRLGVAEALVNRGGGGRVSDEAAGGPLMPGPNVGADRPGAVR